MAIQKYFLWALLLLLNSCTANEENEIKKDDYTIIRRKYHEKIIEGDSLNSVHLKGWKYFSNQLYQEKFLFYQTIRGDAATLTSYDEKLEQIASESNDSNYIIFFKNVLDLRNEHPTLFRGKIEIIDSSWKHVLVYTAKDKKEALLTILNLNINKTFYPVSNFIKSNLLISNYSNSYKDTLLPFEGRIYKLNQQIAKD
jgi:hypothetical protein